MPFRCPGRDACLPGGRVRRGARHRLGARGRGRCARPSPRTRAAASTSRTGQRGSLDDGRPAAAGTEPVDTGAAEVRWARSLRRTSPVLVGRRDDVAEPHDLAPRRLDRERDGSRFVGSARREHDGGVHLRRGRDLAQPRPVGGPAQRADRRRRLDRHPVRRAPRRHAARRDVATSCSAAPTRPGRASSRRTCIRRSAWSARWCRGTRSTSSTTSGGPSPPTTERPGDARRRFLAPAEGTTRAVRDSLPVQARHGRREMGTHVSAGPPGPPRGLPRGGCAAAAARRRRDRPPPRAVAAARPRGLRTGAPQDTVHGSRRLATGPPARDRQVEGYATTSSGAPGAPVALRVSTTARSFDVRAYRIGAYAGGEGRLVWGSRRLPGHVQAGRRSPTASDARSWRAGGRHALVPRPGGRLASTCSSCAPRRAGRRRSRTSWRHRRPRAGGPRVPGDHLAGVQRLGRLLALRRACRGPPQLGRQLRPPLPGPRRDGDGVRGGARRGRRRTAGDPAGLLHEHRRGTFAPVPSAARAPTCRPATTSTGPGDARPGRARQGDRDQPRVPGREHDVLAGPR